MALIYLPCFIVGALVYYLEGKRTYRRGRHQSFSNSNDSELTQAMRRHQFNSKFGVYDTFNKDKGE